MLCSSFRNKNKKPLKGLISGFKVEQPVLCDVIKMISIYMAGFFSI